MTKGPQSRKKPRTTLVVEDDTVFGCASYDGGREPLVLSVRAPAQSGTIPAVQRAPAPVADDFG